MDYMLGVALGSMVYGLRGLQEGASGIEGAGAYMNSFRAHLGFIQGFWVPEAR